LAIGSPDLTTKLNNYKQELIADVEQQDKDIKTE